MLPGRIFTDTAAERPMPALVARLVLLGALVPSVRPGAAASTPPTSEFSASAHGTFATRQGAPPCYPNFHRRLGVRRNRRRAATSAASPDAAATDARGQLHVVGEDDRPEQDPSVAHLDAHRTAAGATRRSVEHRRHSRARRKIDLPNLFGLARARGYTTAAFFSKPKFQPLQIVGTLDYSQAPGGMDGDGRAVAPCRTSPETSSAPVRTCSSSISWILTQRVTAVDGC